MSKKKIREWLENNCNTDNIVDIIHQYTQGKCGWVSVDEYSKLLADSDLCWVLFPDNAVKMCRLNGYKQFGGVVDYWQDMNGNDLFMNATMFIKINQPLPPIERNKI